MNIYIANLHPHVDENQLREVFSPFGDIESAKIIIDLQTGISKGYAFISMPEDASARSAIQSLAGKSILGQTITVKEANPTAAKKPDPMRRATFTPSPKPATTRPTPVFDMTEGLSFTGKIKFFNPEKGYGFIVSHDNQDVFFQHVSLIDMNRIPQPEEAVEFKIKSSSRGPVAIEIDIK